MNETDRAIIEMRELVVQFKLEGANHHARMQDLIEDLNEMISDLRNKCD